MPRKIGYRIRNWSRFQHYKNRRPVWIKLYVELLDNIEFRRLPDAQKGHFCLLLLHASRTDGVLLGSRSELSQLLGLTEKLDFRPFIRIGLLATCYQDASLETETETETEKETKILPKARTSTADNGTGPARPGSASGDARPTGPRPASPEQILEFIAKAKAAKEASGGV